MKRNLYYVALCLFALFTFVLPAEAGGGYTVKLTASANPNTAGTVYVVKYGEGGNDVSKAAASYPCEVVSSKSAYEVFVVYANANRGKAFNGWTDLTGIWTTGNNGFFSGYSPKEANYTGGIFVKYENGAWVKDNDGYKKNPAYIRLQSSTADDYAGLGGTKTVPMYTRLTVKASFKDNDIAPWYVQYLVPEHGNYTVKGPDGPPEYGTVTLGGAAMLTYDEDQIELNATPATGYAFTRYIGEDAEGNVVTLGEIALKKQTIQIPVGIVKVSAEFTQQPFLIGERTFANLDAALQAVETTTSKTILLLQDGYTVPAGNYTIPSGVTLLIPKSDLHVAPETAIKQVISSNNPTKFRKLILGNNVNITVNGTIEVGGTQGAGAQGATGAAIPTATYGQLHMTKDSKITFNNGATLRAWGFVTGETNADGEYLCEIDARRGSTVYEQFQNYDWKGGTNMLTGGIVGNDEKVFPVNTYFIQNVEAPVTYHPGSALHTVTSVNVDSRIVAANVQIVGVDGDIAMFLMDNADTSEDTWVRKWYDTKNDKQVYEVNSSARLGSIILPFGSVSYKVTLPFVGERELSTDVTLRSSDYDLPLTSNLKIHLLTGEMKITQNTVMLPGAEIEIDKTATVIINPSQKLYLYDSDQWGNFVFQDRPATQIKYTASHGGAPNKRTLTAVGLGDAKINVHGTFDVQGFIYTTAGGANIFSSVTDAGTVQFSVNAPSSSTNVYQWINTEVNSSHFVPAACTSAKLKNDAGSTYSNGDGYSETAGTPKDKSWCFIDIDNDLKGEWVRLTTDGCFVLDEETGIYYAKPSDYVALQNGKTPNLDHTFSSADGSRTFILICDKEQTDCQWWEVEYDAESGLYKCDKNGIYYFYNEEFGLWMEKRYTITWLNYDGTVLKDEYNEDITYLVPYGSMPKYSNSTPSRLDDPGYYKYDFVEWTPAFTRVTSDVSYTAVYERNPVMYTITWKNANNTEREVGYFQRDEMPVCRTEPAGMGTSWEWSPVVEPVTGNKTYTLQAITTPKTSFTVTWKNYNGTTLQTLETDTDVPAGTTPTYNGADPSKASLDDVEFIWNKNDGWTPAISPVTADIVYMAKYTEQPKTYTITWNWMDGVDAEHSTVVVSEDVAYKAVPQYTGTTPTKPSDATYHYTFSGWNTQEDGEGSNEIETATSDKTYYAKYDATFKDKVVATDETVDEGKQQTVTNLTIETTGKLVIPTTSRVNATNLILEATSNTSGQLITNANTSINVTENAFFDWTPNGETGTASRTWYAIAVPWEVDAENGIFLKETGRHLVIGQDFDLIYYDGATRASQGNKPACWKYVQHDENKTMHPGQLYMMYFDPGFKTIRFAKKSGADVLYMEQVNVSTYAEETENDGKDANWNGIANPRTYFASLSAGTATYAQVLNNGNLDDYFANPGAPVYQTINLSASKFTVGKPLFVQATQATPVVVTKQTTAGIVNAAPRRRAAAAAAAELPKGIAAVYRLAIAGEDQPEADNLFVQVAEDEKADRYTIGLDLVKGGVASGRAQVWVNRYDAKLSVNTQALSEDEATYPLTIQVPANGDYVLSVGANENEDYTLYLTRNGEAIWNLSEGAYTGAFEKGTTSEYGLRVSAKSPQIATGLDEAVVDAKGETRKVMINDKVFIIRGENVYSVDGQLVK